MAGVHDCGALVASTLPVELGIDVAALHADLATPIYASSGGCKFNTGLFDRRWNGNDTRRKWSEVVSNKNESGVAATAGVALDHPAGVVRRAKHPAWQLAPGPRSHVVMGFKVVWVDAHAKLYVTHYIYT